MEKALVSKGFFDPIIQDVLILVNAEFRKLRINTICRENLILFFEEATAGMSIIELDIKKSRKKILNMRLVKIAHEIAEIHSIPGFKIVVE